MEREFTFPLEQAMLNGSYVCPGCNSVIANGDRDWRMRANQRVHGACALRFDAVMKMRPEISAILNELPSDMLEGTGMRDQLARAHTIPTVRKIITDLCAVLEKVKKNYSEKFAAIAAKIRETLTRIAQRTQTVKQVEECLAI